MPTYTTSHGDERPEYSPGALQRRFYQLTPPIDKRDFDDFHQLFQQSYPYLSPRQRRGIDWIIDLLLLDMEPPERLARQSEIASCRQRQE